MKGILRFVAMLSMAVMAIGMSAREAAFERAARLSEVDYIYLSKDMLSKVGAAIPVEGIDVVTSDLTSMEILSTSSRESAGKAVEMLDDTREGMELMGHISDNGYEIDIYGIKSGELLSELLVLVEGDPNFYAVMMKGRIDPQLIKNLARNTPSSR